MFFSIERMIAQRLVSPNLIQDYLTHRLKKKNIHHVTLQFIVNPQLQYRLVRLNNKDFFAPSVKNFIYSKAFKVIYANSVPVAAECFIRTNVVAEALDTFFLGYSRPDQI